MPHEIRCVTVIGAGAWGTALATAALRAGREVNLLARNPDLAEKLAAKRKNPRLPGVALDPRLNVTADPVCIAQAEAVLLAVPAQALREVASDAGRHGAVGPLIACAKGIERVTNRFMTEIISLVAPAATPAILSGPSFAKDVGKGLPTAVTLACEDGEVAAQLAAALSSPAFRIYHSADMRGVEIGGAAKNVLAIAAGIVVGRKLGPSAAAALTTRGFAEMVRFGQSFGAQPGTLSGLAGLGDLILSCSSTQSRNYSLGVAIGKGNDWDLAEGPLVEGAFTAPVLVQMASERGIEMPIASAVAAVIDKRMTADEAIGTLLARPVRSES